MSDFEYVSIIANYNNIDEDDEETTLRNRGYSEAQIKHILKDTPGSSFKSLNVIFHTKNKLKYPYFSYIVNLYVNYKKGALPYPGSVSQQPAKIMEIFDVLSQLEYESEEKMRKKVEKERKKCGKS